MVEFMTGPLLENPQRLGKALHDELEGYRSARRGQYRVLYWVDETHQEVFVERIDHRADVYRSR